MSTNPLDEFAPPARMVDEVTAASLIRYEAVHAFAQEIKASKLGMAAFDHPSGEKPDPELMRRYTDAVHLLAFRFAVVFLLKAIAEHLPEKADEVAQCLQSMLMDGGCMPEFLHDWLSEAGVDPERVIQAVARADAEVPA